MVHCLKGSVYVTRLKCRWWSGAQCAFLGPLWSGHSGWPQGGDMKGRSVVEVGKSKKLSTKSVDVARLDERRWFWVPVLLLTATDPSLQHLVFWVDNSGCRCRDHLLAVQQIMGPWTIIQSSQHHAEWIKRSCHAPQQAPSGLELQLAFRLEIAETCFKYITLPNLFGPERSLSEATP